MEKLNKDWITDGLIDFEYKKYILLGYLKNVQSAFNKVELYPSLADLIMHYENLLTLKKGREELRLKFPKEIQGIDQERLALIYKTMVNDSEVMKQLEEIIEYSIPMFKSSLNEGKEIYEFVEGNCELSTVGLLPLYIDEGYLLINDTGNSDTNIYRYHLMKLHHDDTNYRAIHTSFIKSMPRRIGESFETIKRNLIKQFVDLPNPATFSLVSKIKFPFDSTLEPIAKRLLVQYISTT